VDYKTAKILRNGQLSDADAERECGEQKIGSAAA